MKRFLRLVAALLCLLPGLAIAQDALPPVTASSLQPFPPLPRILKQTLDPAKHLTQLQAAIANNANSASGGTPVIAFLGDSTSTKNANNAVSQTENLYGHSVRRLREDYPGATIRFNDRGIGGTTWNDLKGIPNFAGGITPPSWYTVTTQPWINTYVKGNAGIGNPAPDAVFLASGTNDANAISVANIKAVLDLLCNTTNFPIVPDIVLFTPHGHTPNNSAATQNGYFQAAGLIRSIAMAGAATTGNTTCTKKIGYVDIGRFDAMARLGLDPVYQPLSRKITASTGNTAFPYTFPQSDGDFEMRLTFPGQATTLFSNSNAINIFVGSFTNLGTETPRVRLATSPTNIVAQYIYATTVTSTSIPTGSGDIIIRISAKQGHLVVEVNNTTLIDQLVARPGGYFSPSITMSAPPAGVSMTIDAYSAGQAIKVQRTLTDAQMWGGFVNDANGNPIDGNAINHESSYGAAFTLVPALEAVKFAP